MYDEQGSLLFHLTVIFLVLELKLKTKQLRAFGNRQKMQYFFNPAIDNQIYDQLSVSDWRFLIRNNIYFVTWFCFICHYAVARLMTLDQWQYSKGATLFGG